MTIFYDVEYPATKLGKKGFLRAHCLYICDGTKFVHKDFIYGDRMSISNKNLHFCGIDCALDFCKSNNIPTTGRMTWNAIRQAIVKKIGSGKPVFHKDTLLKLQKYLTAEKLYKGVKFRQLKIDVFGRSDIGGNIKDRIVKQFDLKIDRSNGYIMLYNQTGYKNFKAKEKD